MHTRATNRNDKIQACHIYWFTMYNSNVAFLVIILNMVVNKNTSNMKNVIRFNNEWYGINWNRLLAI